MLIKPIETKYAGCRFRSRLEARWAVFFNEAGINWEYEPEGFELPSGRRYLPDFRLHLKTKKLWVEVKPEKGNVSLFEEFMSHSCDMGTVLREIPQEDIIKGGIYYSSDFRERPYEPYIYNWGSKGVSAFFFFCVCPECGAVDFTKYGKARETCCYYEPTDYPRYTANCPRLMRAFTAARSARFESR